MKRKLLARGYVASSAVLLVSALAPGRLHAQASAPPSLLSAKLTASDGADGDNLGLSVAVSGHTAVTGARFDDNPGGNNAGAAYVFVRAGLDWIQQAKLTAPDGAANDNFGISVAVSADTLVVGAYNDDTPAGDSAGSVHVFVRSGTTWTHQAKLTAAVGAAFGQFGRSVSLQADTLLVGAVEDGATHGSAYVFVRSGTMWTEQAKLTAPDGENGDFFGISVAVSGDTALVGAMVDNTAAGIDAGSAYVFRRSGTTWRHQAKLTASDGSPFDYFGVSVDLNKHTAVVGAFFDDPSGSESGSAYVFVRSGGTWTQQAKLTASDGAVDDVFGVSVALQGNVVMVGANRGGASAMTDEGSVYAFFRSGSTWIQLFELTAPVAACPVGTPFGCDDFGISVALGRNTLLVGAQWDDSLGFNSGAAYAFWR